MSLIRLEIDCIGAKEADCAHWLRHCHSHHAKVRQRRRPSARSVGDFLCFLEMTADFVLRLVPHSGQVDLSGHVARKS